MNAKTATLLDMIRGEGYCVGFTSFETAYGPQYWVDAGKDDQRWVVIHDEGYYPAVVDFDGEVGVGFGGWVRPHQIRLRI